jgi:RND family efflux transporter MFP subunit
MNPEKVSLDQLRIHREARPRGRRWVLPAILAGCVVLAGAGFWARSGTAPLEVETLIARQAVAGEGSGQRTLLNASGYVTARRAATVSSKVTGKVTEVLIEEGMKVERGQVLARLDGANVEAGLRLAQAQLEMTRSTLEETRPNLAFSQRELIRITDLAAHKVVSDSDLRRAEMETHTWQARIARQKAEMAVRESEIGQWQQQLDDTVIVAPFSGVVTSKNAQPGEMISPMSAGGFTRTGICTIVDMSSLEIEIDVNESYINRVEPGQPVEATLDAYSSWRIPAKVIAIIPTADRQKATVRVRVGFEAIDPRILPEMGVKVAFRETASEKPAAVSNGAAARPGFAVPKEALEQGDGRKVVWVVQGARVERRAVTAEPAPGGGFVVSAGLNEGEHVVINAPRGLTDGSRVIEKKP